MVHQCKQYFTVCIVDCCDCSSQRSRGTESLQWASVPFLADALLSLTVGAATLCACILRTKTLIENSSQVCPHALVRTISSHLIIFI